MALTYRRSRLDDRYKIQELIGLRFGDRDKYGVCDSLDDRYLLAFNGDTLVAMTGLNDSKFYNGLELDWTCIRKEYEGNGIITGMVKMCINELDNYTKNIYASCWKLGDNNQVNLVHCMSSLGFKPVTYKRVMATSRHNNCGSTCVNYKEGCWCCEDLYLREGGKRA